MIPGGRMADTNYEFLDCGNERRLERFGEILVDRPAPQALFPPSLPQSEWDRADARFERGDSDSRWDFRRELPESFPFLLDEIRMELRFSPNGQVGIYPEQRDNWRWIQRQTGESSSPLKVLNGFAYTGGSTLFASRGGKTGPGAEVCHLDASKSAVNWARRNVEISSLKDQTVRFIVEDIIRFLEREIKRGRQYQGIILDPPAFGRAAGGKTWVLKRDLHRLMDLSRDLFREDPRFFLISCHDPEVSSEMLVDQLYRFDGVEKRDVETLDLVIPSSVGNDLPNGIAARWRKPD